MILNSIKQMERLARGNSSIISLGQGIPAGRSHDHIRERVIEALQTSKDIDRYSDPQGLSELRSKISKSLQEDGMRYGEQEITVTAGAIEALNSVLLTVVSPAKNEVIVPMPTYSAYERAVTLAKGKTIPVRLNEALGWRLDSADMVAVISPKTAAVLLCNPNNPTGMIYDKQLLLELAVLAKQHGFLIILDEVYGNMLYNDAEFYQLCTNDEYRQQVVRIVSFSKDFCLTGWRIGYMHTDASLMQDVVPMHDTLVNCAPVISQYAALAALDIAAEIIAQNRTTYNARRGAMKRYLDALPDALTYKEPEGGYFYFPLLPAGYDAFDYCNHLANKHEVIAIPGDDFGIGGSGHIRLCFGRSTRAIHEGMQKLKRCMDTACYNK
ncbi:MAG: pyridoxal phosphate-dependent aminotransferase [Candidatus Saccharimonadales bacterium]